MLPIILLCAQQASPSAVASRQGSSTLPQPAPLHYQPCSFLFLSLAPFLTTLAPLLLLCSPLLVVFWLPFCLPTGTCPAVGCIAQWRAAAPCIATPTRGSTRRYRHPCTCQGVQRG